MLPVAIRRFAQHHVDLLRWLAFWILQDRLAVPSHVARKHHYALLSIFRRSLVPGSTSRECAPRHTSPRETPGKCRIRRCATSASAAAAPDRYPPRYREPADSRVCSTCASARPAFLPPAGARSLSTAIPVRSIVAGFAKIVLLYPSRTSTGSQPVWSRCACVSTR